MVLPQEFIEQVKNANNIVAVAGRYLSLKQKGRQHWACCPFHHEKTPSFAITEETQFYHCFGCHESGGVIKLVQYLENCTFIEAVTLLAKWAGIKMPEVERTPEEQKRYRERAKAFEILEESRAYYVANLQTDKGKEARDYLNNRGVTDELIKEFNVGLSLDWESLITHLKSKGFYVPDMVLAGVVQKASNGRFVDTYAERITFSIFDNMDRCIGFTGRVQPSKDDGKFAKYKNSPQTVVFDKSNIVYGADVLKRTRRNKNITDIIVVEGNVDVISLVANGFDNTLATMGTAFTKYHIDQFAKFGKELYLCFDGDNAGRVATLRALDVIAEVKIKNSNLKIDVRVVELPKDVDPDTYIRSNGKDAFQKLIDTAKPYIDYKLDVLNKSSKLNDSVGQEKYLVSAIEVLRSEKDITPELYVDKIASIVGVPVEAIMRKYGSSINRRPQKEVVRMISNLKIEIDGDERAKRNLEDIKNGVYKGTAVEKEKELTDIEKRERDKRLKEERDSGNCTTERMLEINKILKGIK